MTAEALRERFDACDSRDKLILALLALAGEPMGRRRIHEHLAPISSNSQSWQYNNR